MLKGILNILHLLCFAKNCLLADDEPDDGPQHYIIVTGFHSPHLPGQLAEIGINLDCIIRFCSADYGRYDARPEAPATEEADVKVSPKQSNENAEKDEKTLGKN